MGIFQSAVNQTLGSISGALAYQKHMKMEAERRARAEQAEQKTESAPTVASPASEETSTTPVEKKQQWYEQWYDKVFGGDPGAYPDLGAEFRAARIAEQSAIAERSAQKRLEAKTNVRTRLPFEPAPPTIREGD